MSWLIGDCLCSGTNVIGVHSVWDTRVLPKLVQGPKTLISPKIFSINTLSTISENPYVISFQGLHSATLDYSQYSFDQYLTTFYQQICAECCFGNFNNAFLHKNSYSWSWNVILLQLTFQSSNLTKKKSLNAVLFRR